MAPKVAKQVLKRPSAATSNGIKARKTAAKAAVLAKPAAATSSIKATPRGSQPAKGVNKEPSAPTQPPRPVITSQTILRLAKLVEHADGPGDSTPPPAVTEMLMKLKTSSNNAAGGSECQSQASCVPTALCGDSEDKAR
mmetsp:Transcript_7511/g.16581  ORF Transcript_7511/g.16581 Transcript_7511/m.16581 type:complete len:139 (+) Transcript_7511:106-522(+)